jgi:hypothetical protein
MTEQFHYTHNGATITLPYVSKIRMGIIRKIRRLPGDDQVFTLLEEIADKSTLAAIDEMDASEFEKFVTAWQQESGVTVGESAASSTS